MNLCWLNKSIFNINFIGTGLVDTDDNNFKIFHIRSPLLKKKHKLKK